MKKIFLLSVAFSELLTAHSEERNLLNEFKSDFLCFIEDAPGMHSDEGYTLNRPAEQIGKPEVRFNKELFS